MITKEQYEWLESEVRTLDNIIALLPEDDVVTRSSFQQRREEVRAELAASPPPDRWPVNADLHFEGEPVTEHGIDASFSANALLAFNKIIAGLTASFIGPMGSRGPLRNQASHQLLITGITRGSFGFQIEERPNPQGEFNGHEILVEDALGEAMNLLDDHPTNAIVSDRVQRSVNNFFDLLEKQGAECRLSLDNRMIHVKKRPSSQASFDFDSGPKMKEAKVRGHFEGFLPRQRTAEFYDSEERSTIRGRVSGDWHGADEINRGLLFQPVIVTMVYREHNHKKAEFTFMEYEHSHEKAR